jgi:glycogen operon protein
MTTLLLSAGVPMVLAGDEFGHSQQGNNNAYCQDNDITWLNWNLTDEQRAFMEFVRLLIHIRRTQPVFQRRKFFEGRQVNGSDVPDVSWFQPSGEEMSDDAWGAGFSQCLGVRFPGDLIGDVNERGEAIVGDSIVLLVNAHHEPIPFSLPTPREDQDWDRLVDTADLSSVASGKFRGGEPYTLQGRSMVVFRSKVPEASEPFPAMTGAHSAHRI